MKTEDEKDGSYVGNSIDSPRRPAYLGFLRNPFEILRWFLSWKWCTCKPLGWLNVQHSQIMLISLLISFVCMTSNVKLILAIMMADHHGEGFDWSPVDQMFGHAIFFIGEMIIHLTCFPLMKVLLRKLYASLAVLTMCLILLATPAAFWFGGYCPFLAVRFVTGMVAGGLVGISHKFINGWMTRREKLMCYSMALSGNHMGHCALMILVTAMYEFNRYIVADFAAMAIYGCSFLFIWLLFGCRNPDLCNYLSDKEREYLLNNREYYDGASFNFTKIPWHAIFTNYQFVVATLAEVCFQMAYWVSLSQAPLYFAEALGYPYWKAGLVCALPHFFVWISCYPVGYTVQLFIRAKIISVTSARKFCNVIGLILGGGAFIALGATRTLLGAVTSYTALVTFGMYHYMGAGINHLDLAPKYAGVLLSLVRGFGNISAIAAPALVCATVTDLQDKSLWEDVYYMTGIISIVGGLAFFLLGSAEVQSFNYFPP